MKYLFHVAIPLFVGFMIYLLSRANDIIAYKWIPIQFSFKKLSWLPYWVKYNLPDGLWLYALTTLMILLWKRKINIHSSGWIFSGFIIAVITEFGQKYGYVPGTFDWMDLVFYLIAMFLAILQLISFNKLNIFTNPVCQQADEKN